MNQGQARSPSAPLSVLLVDDLEEAREMYASYFRFAGVGVTTAVDGRDALQMSMAHPPDVIVLDLCMPVMDGWRFLACARTHPRLRQIPIVALTAYADGASEQAAREAGATTYVPKPCLPNFLLSVVRRVAHPPPESS